MFENRLQEYWSEIESESYATQEPIGMSAAFVPCPCQLSQYMSAAQLTQAEQLYRLALEQAQAQVARRQHNRVFDFSQN